MSFRSIVCVQCALLMFVMVHAVCASPVINEVMPHSNNSWSDEWVELYNPSNETAVLVGWKVSDASSNDTISLNISAGGFGLIVDNNTLFGNTTGCAAFNISNSSCAVLTAIGNGLNDGADTVFLYENASVLVDNFSWSSDIKSTGRSWSRYLNGTSNWTNCTPTPGLANNCTVAGNESNSSAQNIVLTANLSSPAIVDTLYAGIFNASITNKTNCSISDNVTVYYNITLNSTIIKEENATFEIGCNASVGNWTPNATGDYLICGQILNTTVNETNTTDNSVCTNVTVVGVTPNVCDLNVFVAATDVLDLNASHTLNYNITINDSSCNATTHPVNVTYQIDDLFGNNIRSPYTSSTTMTCNKTLVKTWSSWPEISGSEAYLVKANITAPGCNDTNATNDYAEYMVVLKGGAVSRSSWINITDVSQGSDNLSDWGESFDVWIDAYRGDTSQYSVTAYVRYADSGTKVSDESTVHVLSKYYTNKVKIPILLKSNCAGTYPNGDYALVVGGLNQSANRTINVSGTLSSVCQTVTVTASGGGGSGGGGCGAAPQNVSEVTGEDGNFYFIGAPGEVGVEQTFDVIVRISTGTNTARNFTVYSYVFNGSKILSEGLTADGWKGGADANVVNISIAPGESTIVTLTNRVKANTSFGDYSLRVRIKDFRDITRSIKVGEDAEAYISRVSASRVSEASYLTGSATAKGGAADANRTVETATANGTSFNRTRRTVEAPIAVVGQVIGKALADASASMNEIAKIVIERVPKQDRVAIPRAIEQVWKGFISGVTQIITSSGKETTLVPGQLSKYADDVRHETNCGFQVEEKCFERLFVRKQ